MAASLAQKDLEAVRSGVGALWEKLRGKRILITGGTGFFGSWLLETLGDANQALGLGAEAVVLTRDPDAFSKKAPHLARARGVRLHRGDVRDFAKPEGSFTHIIHAATEVARQGQTSPADTVTSIVGGTQRVLATTEGQKLESFLYVSSGAVYGPQPLDIDRVAEDSPRAPDPLDPNATYGLAKRLAEHLCVAESRKRGFGLAIARCFAFVGPYMPFESQLAAGNFVKAAIERRPIEITGDGTTLRSYLYASDLAVALWRLLLAEKKHVIYNVGSGESVSIHQLAEAAQSALNPGGAVRGAGTPKPGARPARYVPDVERARADLGLQPTVALEEALRRTGEWLQRQHKD